MFFSSLFIFIQTYQISAAKSHRRVAGPWAELPCDERILNIGQISAIVGDSSGTGFLRKGTEKNGLNFYYR